jgi:transglutaminase-like putative cysteine protease
MFCLLALVAFGQPMKGGVIEPPSQGYGVRPLMAAAALGQDWPGTEVARHWAELKEDRDYIRYQSDSTGQYSEERRKEEQEKVRRSWEMMQGIIIDERRSREPSLPSPPGGDKPSQK